MVDEPEITTPAPIWTRSFVTVLLAQMTFGYASSVFVLLPKYLSTVFHAGAGVIGHVTAVTGLAAVLAIPFVGAAIDRFGRKPLVIVGCTQTAVYAFSWLLVDHVGWLIDVLQMIGGVGFMIAFNAAGTLVADQAPKERLGQAIGIFGAANMAMAAISPAIAEVLAVSVGWHAAFALAGVVALCSLGLALRIKEEPRARSSKRPSLHPAYPNTRVETQLDGDGNGQAAVAALSVPAQPDAADAPSDRLSGYPVSSGLGFDSMYALLKRQLPHSIAMTTCGAAYGAVSTFYQPFVIAQGATHVSGFFIGFTVAAVSIRVFFGSLPDRLGRRRTAITSYIGFAIMVLVMTQLTPARLLVFGFMFGCMHGIFYPSLSALCVEQARSAERGRVMTLVMGSFRLGNVLSALVLGWVGEIYGYKLVFVLASLGSVLGVAALTAIPEDKPVTQPGISAG